MESKEQQWLEQLLKLGDEDVKMTEKQSKIVQAAIEVFSEKGYSGSSTSEIAQKAGVAEGTIFRHYKTKKELLISIVSPMIAKFIAPFLLKDFYKVLGAPYDTYEDFLRAVIANRMEFIRTQLPVIRIMLQEIPFHPDLREQFKGVFEHNVLPKIQLIVERFQSQGIIRSDLPPHAVIRLTITNIMGYLLTRFVLLPELKWDDEEAESERLIQFIMHGIAGLYEPGG